MCKYIVSNLWWILLHQVNLLLLTVCDKRLLLSNSESYCYLGSISVSCFQVNCDQTQITVYSAAIMTLFVTRRLKFWELLIKFLDMIRISFNVKWWSECQEEQTQSPRALLWCKHHPVYHWKGLDHAHTGPLILWNAAHGWQTVCLTDMILSLMAYHCNRLLPDHPVSKWFTYYYEFTMLGHGRLMVKRD